MPASGDTVPSSDVNLAQQRNAGPSTIGATDQASASYAAEAVVETITVPVVAGRKYRLSYTTHLLTSAIVASQQLYIRIRDTGVGGVQITYVQHVPAVATPNIETRFLYGEWTAPSTGNQVFVATVSRQGGTATTILKGSAGQPRILSVEWLGANA